jgi:sugar lactone lactonase YvrE
MGQLEIISKAGHLLAEGPHWSDSLQSFCWVDILTHSVHIFHEQEILNFTGFEYPSAVTASWGTNLEVVDRIGVWNLDISNNAKDLVASIPQGNIENRSNEAQRDPKGNLWIGRMNIDDSKRTGEMIRMDKDGNFEIQISDMAIPNTLAWDTHRETMYFADSAEATIFAAPFMNGEAIFSETKIFAQLESNLGSPDGSALNSSGNLFNARWGAGRVLEFNALGEIVSEISLPTTYITSCAFNATETQLLITTACIPISESDRTRQDGAIYLFTF